MTTESSASPITDVLGLYRLCLEAQQSELDGAPTLRLSLLVDAVRGTVTGQGVATPPEFVVTDPPAEPYPVTGITGTIHGTPSGPAPVTQVINLKGETVVTLKPPAIGSFVIPFVATFAVDGSYTGHGGWSVGGEKVEDATITSISCDR